MHDIPPVSLHFLVSLSAWNLTSPLLITEDSCPKATLKTFKSLPPNLDLAGNQRGMSLQPLPARAMVILTGPVRRKVGKG